MPQKITLTSADQNAMHQVDQLLMQQRAKAMNGENDWVAELDKDAGTFTIQFTAKPAEVARPSVFGASPAEPAKAPPESKE